jgi:hypothetical protein
MGKDRLAIMTNPVIIQWKYAKVSKKPDKCPVMLSVGWPIDRKDRIILVHLKRPDGFKDMRLCTTIPKGCIQSIHQLK